MEKLPMCRICLIENVCMYIVNDQNLQEFYEKLTNIPFVTEDRRPMLACFLCFAKLKQCCQLQRKCLEAEELFAQMMNEPNPSVNRGQLNYSSGLIVTPVENISIVDVGHIENIAVKEELPAVCERLDDVIEPNVEHSKYATAVAKKRELNIQGNKLENSITENDHNSDTRVIQNTIHCRSKLVPVTQESLSFTTPRDNICHINTALDTNFRNNIKKRNLIKHIREDTGQKPFKCDICQSCFSQKSHLKRHIPTHTGANPYTCEECQLRFTQKPSLIRHIRTHTGEKPYRCEECQLCFKRKAYLTDHIRRHSGVKPYQCGECQRCFSDKTSLTRHTRTHTGEKPYKCEECLRCFSQKSTLLSHIRTHTGEKPYKCEECHRCFSQKPHLTKHINTHTVIVWTSRKPR